MRDLKQDRPDVITPRSIALIVGTIVGMWLVYQLRTVGLVLLVALILAGTFNPLIERMEKRGIARMYALILLFLALSAIAALLLFLTIPPIIEQVTQMVHDAPALRTRLIEILNERSVTVPLAHIAQNAGIDQTFARIKPNQRGYSSRAVMRSEERRVGK